MRNSACAIVFLAGLLASHVLAQQPQQSTMLTNTDVLNMLKAGLRPEIVIAKIKSSDCNFDTNPDTLAQLKKANVPDEVILAMVQAHKIEGETVYINCVTSDIKRPIRATGSYVSDTLAEAACGDALTSLGSEGLYAKVRTQQGVSGYILLEYVSKTKPEGPKSNASPQVAVPSPVSSSTSTPRLPSGMLRALAWRAVPWVTTSYYQQPGTANTDCTGSGTWIGSIWQSNASCTTQYTPAQSVPINWQHYTIYNLVETSDSLMVIACTRNWAFSKCSYLIPGNTFPFEYKSGRISVKGHRGGKNKEQSLDLEIVSTQPKT